MLGETISHYRIVEKIGEGGMGVVYVAEDTVLGRRVAIKTLTSGGSAGQQHFRSRFLREARAISKLSHPHIANIYDYGETPDGQPYIVMELVSGSTLGQLMVRENLNIQRAVGIIKQIAEALAEAHRHGIVHRDIKPSNVAINERDNVKVLDFGLAKEIEIGPSDSEAQTRVHTQTREGVIVGTPMYLSPEQALGVKVDARSDVFALGALLYECVAGKPPFNGRTAVEICAKVVRDDPPPPSQHNPAVSDEVDQIALKALAKKPEQRYQTAEEMIAVLEVAIENLRHGSEGLTVTRRISPVQGAQATGALATLSDIFKRPRLSIGYVAAGVLVLGLVVFGIWRLTRATVPPPTAEAQQLYDKAVAALQEGSYFKASRLFERAIADDEKFALAHARLAEAFTELDYTDKAKDHMLSASRLVANRSMPDATTAQYFAAISAMVAHDSPAAISAYTEITRLRSNDAAAYLDLGRAFEANDEMDKAIAQYVKASELDRNNPATWLRSAVLYGRRQDLVKATDAFDKAEGLYKDSQNFEGSSEVSYQRGYLLAQMSKVPEAQKATEQSLNVATTADNKYQQVRALLLLSSIAYSSGNTEQAQTLITRGLELARENGMENLTTQGLLDLSNSLLLRRSFAESERYARQALNLAQSYRQKRNEARANLLLGSIYIQQEDADKGKPFIDQVLNFYQAGNYRREVSRCMVMLGRIQLLKGNFEGAVKTLDEQLQLAKQVEDPGQLARSQAEVAAALSKQDLYPQALVRYTESYELNKQLNNPLNVAFALLNRGDMLARLGRYQEATATLDELIPFLDRLSSENIYKNIWAAWGYLIRGRMALSERQYTTAKAHCEQALKVLAEKDQNAFAEVNSTLGLIAVLSGNPSRGVKQSERAVALAMRTKNERLIANVQLTLAEAQLESGDEKSALTTAMQAQGGLAKLHQDEVLWKAYVIGARACQHLGNDDLMRDQLSNGNAVLVKLQRQWGSDHFQTYASRVDIQAYLRQLAGLPRE